MAIINRMLASPGLPPRVRLIIFEYIEEKSAGVYGDAKQFVRKYTAPLDEQLSATDAASNSICLMFKK